MPLFGSSSAVKRRTMKLNLLLIAFHGRQNAEYQIYSAESRMCVEKAVALNGKQPPRSIKRWIYARESDSRNKGAEAGEMPFWQLRLCGNTVWRIVDEDEKDGGDHGLGKALGTHQRREKRKTENGLIIGVTGEVAKSSVVRASVSQSQARRVDQINKIITKSPAERTKRKTWETESKRRSKCSENDFKLNFECDNQNAYCRKARGEARSSRGGRPDDMYYDKTPIFFQERRGEILNNRECTCWITKAVF